MKRILIAICILCCFQSLLQAQDTSYVRKIVKTLSSEQYFGRGYTKQGVQLAADYLEQEMKTIGLTPFLDSYTQDLSYVVNVFPGAYSLKLDNKTFQAGTDYIISPDCGNINGEFEIYEIPLQILKDSAKLCNIKQKKTKNKFVVLHLHELSDRKQSNFIREKISENFLKARGYILVQDVYPIWSISASKNEAVIIRFDKSYFPELAETIELHVESKQKPIETSNLIGYVPGNTDKTIMFTAHYDHLGGIGDSIFFPGAHDNASGVAACLDIARHYIEKPADYRIIIMLFTGEEAGLLGSTYYSLNPLFPLSEIDFLINLDMVGTGSKGITIVNAKDSTYKDAFAKFEAINTQDSLQLKIQARGISANSDHYPFNEQGVRGVFIYSRGGKTFYHNPQDKQQTVSLAAYQEIFKLITKFADQL
ncbi:MAG: M28 family metallopeptidase [Bacteroidales bacterium]|jgi:aminopeptidase YwaD|nr:M28 family metallopeptidase [Bacteroidales bacterium]